MTPYNTDISDALHRADPGDIITVKLPTIWVDMTAEGPIIMPYTTTTSRDNADMSRNYSHIGHY